MSHMVFPYLLTCTRWCWRCYNRLQCVNKTNSAFTGALTSVLRCFFILALIRWRQFIIITQIELRHTHKQTHTFQSPLHTQLLRSFKYTHISRHAAFCALECVCASYLLLNGASRYAAPLPPSHALLLRYHCSYRRVSSVAKKTLTFWLLQPTGSTSCSSAAPPPLATRLCQLHSPAGREEGWRKSAKRRLPTAETAGRRNSTGEKTQAGN